MIAKILRPSRNGQYPLMRDLARQPKCYELTDQERLEAVKRVDQLLAEQAAEAKNVYYGV
jgi:hypothetical protein